jgi:hypothetical protein
LPSMCKATPRFHLTPSQNGSHQETKNKCWWGYGEKKEALIYYCNVN